MTIIDTTAPATIAQRHDVADELTALLSRVGGLARSVRDDDGLDNDTAVAILRDLAASIDTAARLAVLTTFAPQEVPR